MKRLLLLFLILLFCNQYSWAENLEIILCNLHSYALVNTYKSINTRGSINQRYIIYFDKINNKLFDINKKPFAENNIDEISINASGNTDNGVELFIFINRISGDIKISSIGPGFDVKTYYGNNCHKDTPKF